MRKRLVVQSPGLCTSLLRKLRGGRYFLVAEQESNQRSRLGEALTVKPFGTALVSLHCTPTSSHPPQDPSRPLSLPGMSSNLGCHPERSIEDAKSKDPFFMGMRILRLAALAQNDMGFCFCV